MWVWARHLLVIGTDGICKLARLFQNGGCVEQEEAIAC